MNETFNLISLCKLEGIAPSDINVQANQFVFRQGESAEYLYYIIEGEVKTSALSIHGREGVTAILKSGEFFGEFSLSNRTSYLLSAKTITSSRILKIEKTKAALLVKNCAEFSTYFLNFMLDRNAAIQSDFADQLFNSSEKRLARFLLQLASYGTEEKMKVVAPQVSQSVLAAKIGTTRSQINIFMNKFRDLGLIEYNGDIKVHPSLISIVIGE
jgi:CRP/FNR family transcriptional regulator, cyclic AMP receptor protein